MAAAALLLVVAAMLLASTGLLLQPASAQGLGVAPDLLGAGAQATATAFEEFEDVLNLATVGGRGRGGRCAMQANMFVLVPCKPTSLCLYQALHFPHPVSSTAVLLYIVCFAAVNVCE